MLGYQPPKSRCWGHVIRTKEPHLLREKFDAFFAIYFEQVEQTEDGTLLLTWKQSALPHTEWTDEYFRPELQRFQKQMVVLMVNRVMFMMGLIFPISATDPATFKFLARFNADAPFKMSPQFFKVGTNGKPGKTKWTKPDAAVAAHLQEALG
jgi:hypothetical protein